MFVFFFSSRRRHTRLTCDWSSDVCSSDLRLAALAAAKRRRLALIDEARRQRARDIRDRRALVVAIIALLLASHQHAPGVMIVVVPLRAILSLRRILRG